MAKSLNETELSSASGGKIDYTTGGTIAGVNVGKQLGGKAYVVSGINAKGIKIPEKCFEDTEKGLAAAEQFCKDNGISADLTKAAAAAKNTTLGITG